MLTLGAHMSIAGGFTQAAKTAVEEYGFNAFQLFTKSPRSRQVKPIDPADAQAFREYCFGTEEIKQPRIHSVIAHSSYLLNFGKPMSQIPWALQDIMLDFQRVAELGAHGVVVHIGKSLDGDRKVAINNVVENAKRVLDSTQKMFRKNVDGSVSENTVDYILENTAGQGTEIGFTLEELGELWGKLRGQSPRLKSCLDTAHIWAAGYDISSKEGAQKTLKQYDELIGLKTLACFHFNDSLKALGSRVDRHANIGYGYITGALRAPATPLTSSTKETAAQTSGVNAPHLDGLAHILKFATEQNVPIIMETPESAGLTHHDDLKVVKKMLKKF